MRLRYYRIHIIALLTLAVLAVSCKDEWDSHYNEKALNKSSLNVYEFIQSRNELSTFTQMLKITGYDSILSTSQAYTVWAPNDSALKGVDLTNLDLVSKIVMNHITRFSYTTSDITTKTILMLNNKYIVFAKSSAGYTFGGKTIVESDLATSNGIIHILGEYSTYRMNIWEFISKTDGLDSLHAYINSLSKRELDIDKSFQNGVFVDSVFKETNKFFLNLGKLDVEDSTYTAILPNNTAWNEAYNRIFPYHKTLEKDGGKAKQEELTKWAIVQDLIFRDKITSPVAKDTLISTWGNIFVHPNRLFANIQPTEMSNGLSYVTDQLNSTAEETWLYKIKIEAEQTVFGRTTSNYNASAKSSIGTGYDISNRYYLYLEDASLSSISKLYVNFPLPMTLSAKYNIYCVFVPAKMVNPTDLRPNKVKFYLSYINSAGAQVTNANIDANGKVLLTTTAGASATITTDPTKVDKVLVAKDFEFPYTNIVDFTTQDFKKNITVALKVENATLKTPAEIAIYNRNLQIDYIILEPVQ